MSDDYVPVCYYTSWPDVSDNLNSNSLSALTVNIRSLKSKFSELSAHLSSVKFRFTIIAVTETWLHKDNDLAYELPGYKSHSIYRENQLGGGIKLYYLDMINVNIVDTFTGIFESCEILTAKASINGIGNLFVSCIYRPPNKPLPGFLNYLPEIYDFLCDKKSVLLGDFNIDLCNNYDNIVTHYCDIGYSYGFNNEVNIKTYVSPITGQDKSILDHIWHNLTFKCVTFVIRPALSDHYSVVTVFDTTINEQLTRIRFRDFSRHNIDIFKTQMVTEVNYFNPTTINANEHAEYIINFLTELLNKYFPIKVKDLNPKKLKMPWISKSITKCIDKKHKWYNMLKRGQITMNSYKKYCYALRDLLRMAEEDYIKYKLYELSSDSAANWKIINGLLGKKSSCISNYFIIGDDEIYDPTIIANNFNQYFVEYPQSLLSNLRQSNRDYSQIISIVEDRIFEFDHCNESEIRSMIMLLKNKGNLCDISVKFLKLCIDFISNILCKLFNQCIDEALYPDCFKTSRVTPIFKKGLRTKIENHRPISILCNIGKVFDSIIHDRFTNYFINNNILSDNQFGFRKNRNTELACIQLIDKILPSFTNGCYCICVFLDFSACFDTISRPILFEKLQRYGVRGSSLEFVKSYFCNRKQYVVYSGMESDILHQTLGTIQGSKNGPRFFDVYSNDINFLLNDNQNVLYADDTTIVYVNDDLDVLTRHVNEVLALLFDWCCFNKMIINPSKSQYILLTNKSVVTDPILNLGDDTIERVSGCRYLGMYIDDKLKYHDQVDHITSKLRQYRGVTFRLHRYIDKKSATKIYYSMIYSTITYCITVWGGLLYCTQRGEGIQSLQTRIVKNLFYQFTPYNICVFKANKILKLVDVYKLYVSMYMYKVINLGLCPTLSNNLDLRQFNHDHDTRNRSNLIPPYPRVENIRLNYKYMFPVIWNSIPNAIKQLNSLSGFKRKLIEHFLGQY